MFHQIHQMFHHIKFFNLPSDSCINTTCVDNDTLDETLDTFDENNNAFDGKNDAFDYFLDTF